MAQRKGVFKAFLIIAIAVVVLLFAFSAAVSIVAKSQMTKWLKENGEQQVRIDRVDFNIVTMRMSIHALFAQGPYGNQVKWEKFAFSIGLWPLLKRRIVIENLVLRKAAIMIERFPDDRWRVGGIRFKPRPPAPAKKKKPSWQFGARGIDITTVRIDYRDSSISRSVLIDTFSLDRFESWRPNLPSRLLLITKVADGALSIRTKTGSPAKRKSVRAEVIADSLALGWFSPFAGSKAIADLGGSFGMDLKITATSGPRGVVPVSDISGNLIVKPLVITKDGGRTVLLRSSGISVKGIAVTGMHNATVEEMRFDTLRAVQSNLVPSSPVRGDHAFGIDRIAIERVSFDSTNHIRIGRAIITNVSAAIVRNRDGTLVLPKPPRLPARKKTAPSKRPPPTFAIDTFGLDGKSDVMILDRSVIPEARIALEAMSASLADFSTAPNAKPDEFSFHGSFGPASFLKMNGRIAGIDSGGSGGGRVQLENFSLPLLTGYLQSLYGYQLTTGKLFVTLDGTVKNGGLKGTSRISVRGLQATPLPKAPAHGIFRKKTLGLVSLGAALDLITKQNGDMDLTIPISGDMKKARFHFIGALLETMLTSVVDRAAKSTIAPLGGLLSGNEEHPLRFREVEFAPGSAEVTREAAEYLDSMAGKLRQHPGVRVSICGKAVAADSPALSGASAQGSPAAIDSLSLSARQRLLGLARDRSRAIRSFLFKKGIESKRLFICAPELDGDEKAKPRADLSS